MFPETSNFVYNSSLIVVVHLCLIWYHSVSLSRLIISTLLYMDVLVHSSHIRVGKLLYYYPCLRLDFHSKVFTSIFRDLYTSSWYQSCSFCCSNLPSFTVRTRVCAPKVLSYHIFLMSY